MSTAANTIHTEVYKTGLAEFNQVGQLLGHPVAITNQVISQGLAKRLLDYGLKSLEDSGFLPAVQGWAVEIYTLDADEKPSDRAYVVKWVNEKGGYLEVVGIHTQGGWPALDYGLEVCAG
jgi:hypothetical protein